MELNKMQSTTTKKVSFNRRGRVRTTLSWKDYSSDEFNSTWYTVHEREELRRTSLREAVKGMSKGELYDRDGNQKSSIRGLECQTPRGRAVRSKNRSESILAVLEEQKKQTKEGRKDPIAIARIYAERCLECQLLAIGAGLADRRAVGELHGHNTCEQKNNNFIPPGLSSLPPITDFQPCFPRSA